MTKPDHLSDLKFTDLNLHSDVQTSLDAAGFEYCSPIQAETIPKLIAGKSVAGQAQTGTGKTAAFLLATMHRLLTDETDKEQIGTNPRAFIMAPTRELAIQIHKDAQLLGGKTDLKLGLAYGGANYEKQRDSIAAGCDILIGTPGRLIDFFKQGVYKLSHIQVAVLDEADRMFDLGFIDDVRYIMRRMPPADKRVNLLFSATLSQKVLELAYEHLGDPEHIKIESETVTADRVEQQLFMPANHEKVPLLIGLLRDLKPHRTIIFINTKRDGDRVWGALVANGFTAEVLSGDVPQNKRQRFLEQFSKGEIPILVATDVAARGLHIPEVSHVVNYDLPTDAEDYVHRIGRTARAGSTGHAISFACETYAIHLPEIEAYIEQKLSIDSFEPSLLATDLNPAKRRERKPSNNRGGNRNGSKGNSQNNHRSRADGNARNNNNNNRNRNRRNNQSNRNDGSSNHQANGRSSDQKNQAAARNQNTDSSADQPQNPKQGQQRTTNNRNRNNQRNRTEGNRDNRPNRNQNRNRNRNRHQNQQDNRGNDQNQQRRGQQHDSQRSADQSSVKRSTGKATRATQATHQESSTRWWQFWKRGKSAK